MRVTVIHNPTAGSGDHSGPEIEAMLQSFGYQVRYQSRKAPGLDQAINQPADLIVLAGGDGTVSKLLSPLLKRGLPLAILPLGTANNLAAWLGSAGPIEQLAAGWRSATHRQLDVAVARGSWGERLFVDSAGMGALSEAMLESHRTDLPSGAGKLCQVRSLIKERIARAEPANFGAIADGVALPTDLLLAEVMKVSRLGPGLAFAPRIDSGDGTLTLVYARAAHRRDLLDWLVSAPELGPPPLPTLRVRSVAFGRPLRMLRVGDTFEEQPGTGSAMQISGQSLSVLVPQASFLGETGKGALR